MDRKMAVTVAGVVAYNLLVVYAVVAPLIYGTSLDVILNEVYGFNLVDSPYYWIIISAILIPVIMIKLNIKRLFGYLLAQVIALIFLVGPVIYVINFNN